MKTHTSRWTRAGASWVLQARGGNELARVRHVGTLLYAWDAGATTGTAESLYAAQRAVRKVLREENDGR